MPIDSKRLIQEVLNRIVEILTFMVPITLPGDIQLALGVWALIVAALGGGLAFLARQLRK